jgi:hypothetical protein
MFCILVFLLLVQALSAAAVRDGTDDPEINLLARMGSSGRHPRNIQRGMITYLRPTVDLPPFYEVDCTAIDTRNPAVVVGTRVPVLLPHQLFSYIGRERPQVFASWTLRDRLHGFWQAALDANDPHLSGHAMRAREGWMGQAIPLLVHGDGGQYSNSDSMEIASWGALTARGETWRGRFIMATFVAAAQTRGEGGTWDQLWQARHAFSE